jgi:hypothetical protein
MKRSKYLMWGLSNFVGGALLGWYTHTEYTRPVGQFEDGKNAPSSAAESHPIRFDTSAEEHAQRSIDERRDAQVTVSTSRPAVQPSESSAPVKPPGDPGNLFQAVQSVDASEDIPADRKALHSAYRISCNFDKGINAQVGGGVFNTMGAVYQGGPLLFDVINADEGRATMSGSAGATGSATGSVEVRMAGTSAALTFSGFVPRGDLISTTIFTARNTNHDYLAVMSTHAAGNASMASQFYGTCSIVL